MHLARPVEADRDRETVFLEEIRVGLGQQSAVGGDREIELHTVLEREFARAARRGLHHPAVDQRLAAQEREIEPRAWFGAEHQKVDRAVGLLLAHVL